jgi:hypothetical protein
MAIDRHVEVVNRTIGRNKSDWAIVHFKGFPHVLCLRALRRALLARAIVKDFGTTAELATRIGASRSTVSRLFGGRTTSIGVAVAALTELKLDFEDVCWPLEGDLLERLMREGATIERNGATIVTIDPTSLLPARAETRALAPGREQG